MAGRAPRAGGWLPRSRLVLLGLVALIGLLVLAIAALGGPPRSAATPTAVTRFTNPVIERDFPDPDTLRVGTSAYAYATNSGGRNVQVARSTTLVDWELVGDALPALPRWASLQGGLTWAPEVWRPRADRPYVMYFVTRDAASDRQCIGLATGEQPAGPFVASGERPFVCQVEQGGSIDPATFVDGDGAAYLLYKNDGNCCGQRTRLYLQRLAADGLSLDGPAQALIENDQAWEGQVVEAPTLWKHAGRYYLFYSANSYGGADYAIGYAVADQIGGPYTKPLPGPLVATRAAANGAAVIGPGGQDILLDGQGQTWLMFHAWDATLSYRWVGLERLEWSTGQPVVAGLAPTPAPAPAPLGSRHEPLMRAAEQARWARALTHRPRSTQATGRSSPLRWAIRACRPSLRPTSSRRRRPRRASSMRPSLVATSVSTSARACSSSPALHSPKPSM